MTRDQATRLRLLVDGRREPAEASPRAGRLIVVCGAKGGVGTTTIALDLAVALSMAGEGVELSAAGSDEAPLVAGPGGTLVRDSEHWRNALSGVRRRGALSMTPDDAPTSWCDCRVVDAGMDVDYANEDDGPYTLLVTTIEPASILAACDALRRASAAGWWPEVVINRAPNESVAQEAAARLSATAQRMLGKPIRTYSLPEDSVVLAAARLGTAVGLSHPSSRFALRIRQLAENLLSAPAESSTLARRASEGELTRNVVRRQA